MSALTYPERVLVEGGLEAGLLAGYGPDSRRALIEANRIYAAFREPFGYAGAASMLTPAEAQAKLGKSERYALGLMLTPADSLDVSTYLPGFRPVNVCPRASSGCRAACLNTSGRGEFADVQRARQIRHAFLLSHPFEAGVIIGREIRNARGKYGRDGVTFRFNVVSDYRVEFIFPRFLEALHADGVRAYDYTAYRPQDRGHVEGYHLTYSAKETAHTSDAYLSGVLEAGGNVAMPFRVSTATDLPSTYVLDGTAYRVIDGDSTDDRTTDPRGTTGVIVGLSVKGRAGAADTSGFIRS